MELDELLGQVDVAFIIDTTSSMQPWIRAAREEARARAQEIADKGDLDLRFAVIEYRDHPPEDLSFVTRVWPFRNLSAFQNVLNELTPSGGGNAPEAAYDALIEAGNLQWRENADKIAFLIADSPPHSPCTCGATAGGVVEILGAKHIRLYAISIANYPETTRLFQEITDAIGGKTIEVTTAPEFTTAYAGGMSATSSMVSHTRSLASEMRSKGLTWSHSDAEIASSVGMSELEVIGARAYVTARGFISESETHVDVILSEELKKIRRRRSPRAGDSDAAK